MTPEERQELLQCSQRIAELLYQEACEQNRPMATLNLGEVNQGMAWFKDNPSLVAWANQLPLAAVVDCLGDGHDGVWGLYAQIGSDGQRHEILDWFHLMENLHQVPATTQVLDTVRSFLWEGNVDAAI